MITPAQQKTFEDIYGAGEWPKFAQLVKLNVRPAAIQVSFTNKLGGKHMTRPSYYKWKERVTNV